MTQLVETVSNPGGLTNRAGTKKRFPTLMLFLRKPVGVTAAVFLILVIAAVALAPVIAPFSPLSQDYNHVLSLPSALHPLGSDQLGRDILSRLLWGGRLTLVGVAEALVIAVVLGVVLGLFAGFFRGITDTVISRIAEIGMAIPAIVILLMVFTIFKNNSDLGMVALGLLSTPTMIRVTRGAAMAVREETFISASRVVGMSGVRIVLKHILPNIWGPIIVNAAVLAGVILGVQGGLNYLNLGVNPPAPSWGGMVSEAQQSLQLQPWLIIPSGGIIALVILAFVLVSDALRDVLHSNSSQRKGRRSGPQQNVTTASDSEIVTRAAATLLSVKGMSVSFGDGSLRVVNNVSFELAPGEILGIVGESGCGKTVTASAVLGALPTGGLVTGSIRFKDKELVGADSRERSKIRGSGIAYVSQDPMVSLDPSFRVSSQLGELVGIHDRIGGAARRRRVIELLTMVGLPNPKEVARRYPHELSGGMAQRVSIACALAGRPELLIADEPTTALDVTIQGEILDLLRGLQETQKMAIVLVTHDLGVIADMCDRVVVMYAGEIVENSPAEETFLLSAHPYTRALIESNPILASRDEALRAIPGTVPSPRDWPVGCHFFERCAFRTDACALAAIPLIRVGTEEDHLSRCIHIDEVVSQRA
jgi:peptide/nickel transport system permease protein